MMQYILQYIILCRRNRALKAGKSPYHVIPETVVLSDSSVTMDMVNKQNNVWFTTKIFALEDDTARLQINEKSPLRPRYEAKDILVGDPKAEKYDMRIYICVHIFVNGKTLSL